jgi:steroid delta-isomerase-like uncharacterized protein
MESNEKPSPEKNERRLAIVREHIDAENARDVRRTLATWSPAAPLFIDTAAAVAADTIHDIEAVYEGLFAAFPDLHIDIQTEHPGQDVITIEAMMSGTHQNDWNGINATHRRMSVPLCALFYFGRDDELTCEKIYYDRLTLLQQLGIVAAA